MPPNGDGYQLKRPPRRAASTDIAVFTPRFIRSDPPLVSSQTKITALPENVKLKESGPDLEDHVPEEISLSHIGSLIHIRFIQDGFGALGAVDYARSLLKSAGYPQDEITLTAAIEAWQAQYPRDTVSDSENTSTEPTPQDAWPEFGGVAPDKHRDINFGNDYTSSFSPRFDKSALEVIDRNPSMMAARHTGQLPGDEHLMGHIQVHTRNPYSGVNPSYLGTANQMASHSVYVKPEGDFHTNDMANERAAFHVAHTMGIPMPQTIVRRIPAEHWTVPATSGDPTQKYCQVQTAVPGQTALKAGHTIEGVPWAFGNEARQIALMDHVIGNEDRHENNLIVGDDGHLYPIDHGGAFAPTYEAADNYLGHEFMGEPLTRSERASLERVKQIPFEEQYGLPSDQIHGRINKMLESNQFLDRTYRRAR